MRGLVQTSSGSVILRDDWKRGLNPKATKRGFLVIEVCKFLRGNDYYTNS